MDAVSRYELLQRLLMLQRKYNWAQFNQRRKSPNPANAEQVCSQASNSSGVDANELLDVEDEAEPVLKRTNGTRKARIIVDSDEDTPEQPLHLGEEQVNPEKPWSEKDHEESLIYRPFLAASVEVSPIAMPTTSRRKVRVILSDSEDEIPAARSRIAQVRAISSDKESANEQQLGDSPAALKMTDLSNDSMEGSEEGSAAGEEAEEGDGISLGSDSEAEDESADDGENLDSYEDDGWLVDDSDGAEDSEASESRSGSDSDDNKENTRWHPSNTSKTLPPPKETPKKKPVANARPTPSVMQTPSRTQRNQHRVEAVSTGKKKTKGYHRALAEDLYQIYNELIFGNQLPADLSVTWNKRLLTTAGYCKCRKQYDPSTQEMQRTARIELSNKVVDNEVRLRETLVHEMCHAATWLIDQDDTCAHGKLFKAWGRRATKQFPDIGVVSTCHSYKIHAPHKFQCVREGCGVVYSRHTKKGLNTDRQRCGVCRSELAYKGISNKDGTIAKPRQATAFSAYVKAHFAQVRDELASDRESWEAAPGTKEVMRALAERYKADKSSAGVGGALESVSQGEVQDLTESPAGSVHDSSQAELEVWSDAEEGEDALDALQSAMIDLTV